MDLSGTHPCATDVSFRRSEQVRSGRPQSEEDACGIIARQENATVCCRRQGHTHDSSKAQGGMKAAEDNGSEGRDGGRAPVGSKDYTCTTLNCTGT